MESVVLQTKVRDKIEQLTALLFEKGYFALEKNALAYTDAIYNFIYTIPQRQRSATNYKQYGEWFCRYKPNKHTTWYITFDTDEKTWLVKNVFNNHGPDYDNFLRNVKKPS
jgi:hypothetical protein